MSDLPTGLDTLLEAVAAMMGEEFADMVSAEIDRAYTEGHMYGRLSR
jgi:hypothetical protein